MDYVLPWVVNRFSYVDFKGDVVTDISEVSKEEEIEQEIAQLQKKLALLKVLKMKEEKKNKNEKLENCLEDVIYGRCGKCMMRRKLIEGNSVCVECSVENENRIIIVNTFYNQKLERNY